MSGSDAIELQPATIRNVVSVTKCSISSCAREAKFVCSLCPSAGTLLELSAKYCSTDCQLQDWPHHQLSHVASTENPNSTASDNPPRSTNDTASKKKRGPRRKRGERKAFAVSGPNAFELDADTIDELRYYLVQIYSIVKPVVCCIAIAILWMRLTNPPTPYFDIGVGSVVPSIYANGVTGVVGGGRSIAEGEQQSDGIMAAIIIGQIVVATFIILALFHYNCMRVLYGFFGLIVLGLLGYFSYFLGIQLLSTYLVPFDYITFAFFVWNIAATGLVSVFWKGPLWLQQVYMVFMSTLMALSLSSISAITSWILLSLLAVWDLIAVLCPYGPLKLLIESSQKNNRNIPALLYTAGPTTMMAAPGIDPTYREAASGFLQATANEPTASQLGSESVHGSTAPLAPPADEVVRTNGTSTPSPNPPLIEDDDDEPAQSGMKLGLGDFVFYSVLASRAALLDWISTVTVVVAVVTGLNFTIFLLVLFQKALPALPISIVFGLLFYFVSFLTLVPLVNELMYLPPRLNVTPVTGPGSALWVGQNGGAGMVYL